MITDITKKDLCFQLKEYYKEIIDNPLCFEDELRYYPNADFEIFNFIFENAENIVNEFVSFLDRSLFINNIIGAKNLLNLKIDYNRGRFVFRDQSNIFGIVFLFDTLECFEKRVFSEKKTIFRYVNPFFTPFPLKFRRELEPIYKNNFSNCFLENDNFLKGNEINIIKSFFKPFNSSLYKSIVFNDNHLFSETLNKPKLISGLFPELEISGEKKEYNNCYDFFHKQFNQFCLNLDIETPEELKTFLKNIKMLNRYFKTSDYNTKGVEIISVTRSILNNTCCNKKSDVSVPLIRLIEKVNNKEITFTVRLTKNICIKDILKKPMLLSSLDKCIETDLTLNKYRLNKDECLSLANLLLY